MDEVEQIFFDRIHKCLLNLKIPHKYLKKVKRLLKECEKDLKTPSTELNCYDFSFVNDLTQIVEILTGNEDET